MKFILNQNHWLVKFLRDLNLEGITQALAPDIPTSHRVFWTIVFILMFGLCFGFIWLVVMEYIRNPVLISETATNKSCDQVPFGSITVCNVNMINKTKVDEFYYNIFIPAMEEGTVTYNNVTWNKSDAIEGFYHLDHRCNLARSFVKFSDYLSEDDNSDDEIGLRHYADIWFKNQNVTLLETETYKNKILPFIKSAIQSCENLIPVCGWLGSKPILCKGQWVPVETDAGLCCTFNMEPEQLMKKHPETGAVSKFKVPINDSEIDAWNGYNIEDDLLNDIKITANNRPSDRMFEIPKRQYRTGRFSGFSFMLNPGRKNETFCGSHDSIGFILAVHSPDEIPDIGRHGKFIEINREVRVDVTARVRLAGDGLDWVSKEKRNCCLKDECTLDEFHNYTRTNCISECVAKLTNDVCGCYMENMPRPANSTICGPKNYNCTEDIKKILDDHGLKLNCSQCLDRCNVIKYDILVTHLKMRNNLNMQKGKLWSNNEPSIVHVFFGNKPIETKILQKTSSFWNVFGNIGGIVGLCLDCSIPGIMQVIYAIIFTLILGRFYKKKGKGDPPAATGNELAIIDSLTNYGNSGRESTIPVALYLRFCGSVFNLAHPALFIVSPAVPELHEPLFIRVRPQHELTGSQMALNIQFCGSVFNLAHPVLANLPSASPAIPELPEPLFFRVRPQQLPSVE